MWGLVVEERVHAIRFFLFAKNTCFLCWAYQLELFVSNGLTPLLVICFPRQDRLEGVMSPVTAICSLCGYQETKKFDLVGVALRDAAMEWGAKVQKHHNFKPGMNHQITITLPRD